MGKPDILAASSKVLQSIQGLGTPTICPPAADEDGTALDAAEDAAEDTAELAAAVEDAADELPPALPAHPAISTSPATHTNPIIFFFMEALALSCAYYVKNGKGDKEKKPLTAELRASALCVSLQLRRGCCLLVHVRAIAST